MIKRKLTECEKIFLDTGILIDLLKIDLGSDAKIKHRIECVRSLISTLSETKSSNENDRSFLVSAISIAEIFHIDERHPEMIQAISMALDSDKVEIIAFDTDLALFHNEHLEKFLGNKSIRAIKAEGNHKNSYVNIDDRIRKDMLIVATAKYYNPDVVLTTDGGFHSLCEKADLFCVNVQSKNDFLTSQDEKKVYDFAPQPTSSSQSAEEIPA